jgi:hypothetical protein
MAIQTLGQTTNFTVTFEDTLPTASRRAQVLLAGIEDDLNTLLGWFSLDHTGFGSGNRITVQVQTQSLARNNGYRSDGTMLITLDSLESTGANAVGDDGAMGLFVAEMSEVLMSYRAQKKNGNWDLGDSNGEGLSRFCTGMMHPTGYYGVSGMGPSVNTWATASDRNQWNRDFVTRVNKTDSEAFSYGCATMFIYYLYAQLNFGIANIIVHGGKLLADTYQNLTGKTDGWTAFTNLLDSYLPADKISSLPTDNPFPLLPANERRVGLTFNQVQSGAKSVASAGVVLISPYLGCPADTYSYEIDNTPQLDHCVATVSGFAQPQFTWTVNGKPIDVPVGGGTVIDTITSVLVDNPGDPDHPTPSWQSVQILCRPISNTWTWQAMQGGLDLYPYSTPGHVLVNVSVSVSEQYAANTGVTSTSKIATIDQQTLKYELRYYIDRDRCMRSFWDRVRQISNQYAESRHLFIWQTLPDPGPELVAALRVVEELRGALAEIEQDHPREARQLRSMVATMLHTSPALLGGHGTVPTGEAQRSD